MKNPKRLTREQKIAVSASVHLTDNWMLEKRNGILFAYHSQNNWNTKNS